MERILSTYKNAVTNNFNFLKEAANIQEAYLRAIPIADEGFLIPICNMHKNDKVAIKLLTEWRNKNVQVYPTQFTATEESTSSWLENKLLAVEDRILFFVQNRTGDVIGHIGFNGCHNNEKYFEIDNVVRGVEAKDPGLFGKALQSLIEWARKLLNVDGFFLRVMDDNKHAIQFYEKNGFYESKKIPLVSTKSNNVISYKEASAGEKPEKFFIKMTYRLQDPAVGEKLILTAGPSISEKESVYAFDAAKYGWNRNWSKYLTKFEQEFAKYVGVKYALATSSCTGALQIALMALDIQEGDEVIVPDQTWVATANAVRYTGATPIFADVELDTWNIDATSVEKLITNKTKAIIAVHMYGHPARMDAILAIAEKYRLKVVEDAAPAIGAEWQGKRCGSFGSFAAFSFQGAKLMVTGEGGMLVTNDDELYKKALKIWDQGRNPTKTFWIDEDGVKFKMSNVQAAVGLAQLERVDELIEMKRRIFSWYQSGLKDTPYIKLNSEVAGARSIYWMSSIILDTDAPISRDQLMQKLKENNIDSRPVFPAISQYPIWPKKQSPKANAMHIGLHAINLPSGVCLNKNEVDYICKKINEILTAD